MIQAATTKNLSGKPTHNIVFTADITHWRNIKSYLEEAGFGEYSAQPQFTAAFTAFWAELEAAVKEAS